MFKAIVLTQDQDQTRAILTELPEADLPTGDVDVQIDFSTLNFKDALAITGKGPIVKQWPMVAGIDFSGTVLSSRDILWAEGDQVVVTGWGLGETNWGGLAQRCRIQANWALRPPLFYCARDCMVIGTAGVTAALSVMALLQHNLTPDDGDVLVTGAAGGVGSVAVMLLARLGFHVIASTGRPEEREYLEWLGAKTIIHRSELDKPGRPLARERWCGVVDSVGGLTLAAACAATKWNGAVAACGLAASSDFPTTVMPFILRGVTLYGINSVYVPNGRRRQAWQLLADKIGPGELDKMCNVIGLSDVIAYAPEILAGKARGRTVVDVNR